MRRFTSFLYILLITIPLVTAQGHDPFLTRFELSKGLESATYAEAIDFYKRLDTQYKCINMEPAGKADGDLPQYVVYFTNNGRFNKAAWHKDGKIIMLINNGIHPGEPDGVDASMMLLRDAAEKKITIPDNIVLAVIPVYNIGGSLNRTGYSRANQNGPVEYGFRGNGQNLDLNRDFIKCDALETRSFEKLFTALDPDFFIDNHVSDGADYQHLMTLLATQHDKLGGKTGTLMYEKLTPYLYTEMKAKGYDMVPYVNDFDNTPENGWREFYEPPRFSSGYASLFQTISYVPETHMLKPYKDRVMATYSLMQCLIKMASLHTVEIKAARADDRAALKDKKGFVLDWKPDTTRHDNITFMGYQSGYKTSEVSGIPRLYYDHKKPFTKQVPFYDHFIPIRTVTAPQAYIIPRSWKPVIKRLKYSGVVIDTLANDTTINVIAYHIDNYETVQRPYEKHYLHKNIQVTRNKTDIRFLKGDYVIWLNQPAKRYLVETLEPNGPDAFLAWNFFDGIFQQKEGYSDYVFEDMAADILKKDAGLKTQLLDRRKQDTAFAKNGGAQLDFVYRHSKYYEPTFMRYPVFRLE